MDPQAALASALELHHAGRLGEADTAYRRIPADTAQGADALFLRGVIAYRSHRPRDAVPLMAQAIALRPTSGHFYLDLGNALHADGRLDQAVVIMQRTLAFDRENAAAAHNLDRVAFDLARRAVFQRDAGDLVGGERTMRLAMIVGPAVPEAHFAHGTVAFSQGLCVAACTAFQRTVQLKPDFAGAASDYLFSLCFRDDVSREDVLAAHRAFDIRHMRSIPRLPARPRDGENPSRPLVVGYLSPDFRTHPGGNFLSPMFTHHDPARFRLIAYYANDVEDQFTRLCSARAHSWVPCKHMSDQDLAERIRDDRVDILVECAGHMARNRLAVFARRPAPIQISFPLYPNTTGVEAIDYRLGDPYFTPPWLDRFYSEKIMLLPETCACYQPGYEMAEPVETPPARLCGTVTFGSFNNIAKLSPTTLRLWAAILRQVPASRLVIKWSGLGVADPAWLADRFLAAGIGHDRVQFLGRSPEVYAPFRELDICLDPYPANGGTTTCDALWMGVPVVTLAGDTTFSRAGLGLLTNVGLTELVAHDEQGYVELAVSLARDLDRLARLRRGLRQRFAASPMMDGKRYVRHLEAAYRRAWHEWCAGG
ncbi:MAG: tetratricopeptide repeat protein [Alphaproteobacteria bacterium]|nr:tetratricopeptide repeat protein [Alphaproteobacteria bacterium]